jgi:hypothetical protein
MTSYPKQGGGDVPILHRNLTKSFFLNTFVNFHSSIWQSNFDIKLKHKLNVQTFKMHIFETEKSKSVHN